MGGCFTKKRSYNKNHLPLPPKIWPPDDWPYKTVYQNNDEKNFDNEQLEISTEQDEIKERDVHVGNEKSSWEDDLKDALYLIVTELDKEGPYDWAIGWSRIGTRDDKIETMNNFYYRRARGYILEDITEGKILKR